MNFQAVLIGLAVLTVLGAGWLGMQAPQQTSYSGALLQHPLPVDAFELSGVGMATPVTEQHLDGQWTLISTGFTHCPEVCPVTTAQLRAAYAHLSPDLAQRLHHWFVSVDPRRDTDAALAAFLTQYGPGDSVALRGDAAQLQTFSRAVHMVSPRHGFNEDVAHSGSIALIDPNRNLRALFRYPHQPDRLAHLLTTLIEENRS